MDSIYALGAVAKLDGALSDNLNDAAKNHTIASAQVNALLAIAEQLSRTATALAELNLQLQVRPPSQ